MTFEPEMVDSSHNGGGRRSVIADLQLGPLLFLTAILSWVSSNWRQPLNLFIPITFQAVKQYLTLFFSLFRLSSVVLRLWSYCCCLRFGTVFTYSGVSLLRNTVCPSFRPTAAPAALERSTQRTAIYVLINHHFLTLFAIFWCFFTLFRIFLSFRQLNKELHL